MRFLKSNNLNLYIIISGMVANVCNKQSKKGKETYNQASSCLVSFLETWCHVLNIKCLSGLICWTAGPQEMVTFGRLWKLWEVKSSWKGCLPMSQLWELLPCFTSCILYPFWSPEIGVSSCQTLSLPQRHQLLFLLCHDGLYRIKTWAKIHFFSCLPDVWL